MMMLASSKANLIALNNKYMHHLQHAHPTKLKAFGITACLTFYRSAVRPAALPHLAMPWRTMDVLHSPPDSKPPDSQVKSKLSEWIGRCMTLQMSNSRRHVLTYQRSRVFHTSHR